MPKHPQLIVNDRYIDFRRLSQRESFINSKILLEDCPRLKGLLALEQSRAFFDLNAKFWVDNKGLIRVEGVLKGDFDLTCQRCLEGYKESVDLELSLICFETEQALEEADSEGKLPLDGEAETIVLSLIPDSMIGSSSVEEGGQWFSLAQLVEDDLILALPQVPRHSGIDEQNSCSEEAVRRVGAYADEQAVAERGSQLADGLAALKEKLSLKSD